MVVREVSVETEYLAYTDKDGNNYSLLYAAYEGGKDAHACNGCAFMGRTTACREAKSCTPKYKNGTRVVGAGYVWKLDIKDGDGND